MNQTNSRCLGRCRSTHGSVSVSPEPPSLPRLPNSNGRTSQSVQDVEHSPKFDMAKSIGFERRSSKMSVACTSINDEPLSTNLLGNEKETNMFNSIFNKPEGNSFNQIANNLTSSAVKLRTRALVGSHLQFNKKYQLQTTFDIHSCVSVCELERPTANLGKRDLRA